MLSHYKARFNGLSDPVAGALLRAHVRPNQLTVLGLGVSCLAAGAFSQEWLRAGALLLAVAGLFDFFDGALARLSGQESCFGAFLDSVVDRYSDVVVLLGIAVLYHRNGDRLGGAAALATLLGTVMVSYTKARAQSIGVQCEIGSWSGRSGSSGWSSAACSRSSARSCSCSPCSPTSPRCSASSTPGGRRGRARCAERAGIVARGESGRRTAGWTARQAGLD
jgi:phosphatidylinositol phosphate synthase